ncbi:hypothetical protein SDC9_176051 [bioreactor metagenome]|uniref:Uncharacterized protein n=1 Tax=bioreactor metagenome TaxID=1076179 RepID=A0A645GS00_9ZZZZ
MGFSLLLGCFFVEVFGIIVLSEEPFVQPESHSAKRQNDESSDLVFDKEAESPLRQIKNGVNFEIFQCRQSGNNYEKRCNPRDARPEFPFQESGEKRVKPDQKNHDQNKPECTADAINRTNSRDGKRNSETECEVIHWVEQWLEQKIVDQFTPFDRQYLIAL